MMNHKCWRKNLRRQHESISSRNTICSGKRYLIEYRGAAGTLYHQLHELHGSDFIRQLKIITECHEFKPLKANPQIYSVGGEGDDDYAALLDAANKATEYGYRVFILPNPHGVRTADFIFERRGVYKLFDLKTIVGKNSARPWKRPC